MKSVLLIGLGRFGRHMAQKLQNLDHEVLAVDSNEQRVNEALDLATGRFLHRFARMEALAREQDKDFAALTLDEKDELWNRAKEEEKAAEGDRPQES